MDTITKEESVQSALLIYKNLQITTSELINEMMASHLDKVNLGVVLQALLSDIAYEPGKIKNIKAARLYQLSHAILKAKEVIRADLKDKLSEDGDMSEESKAKVLKEL